MCIPKGGNQTENKPVEVQEATESWVILSHPQNSVTNNSVAVLKLYSRTAGPLFKYRSKIH